MPGPCLKRRTAAQNEDFLTLIAAALSEALSSFIRDIAFSFLKPMIPYILR
jgi:hypothetical protein